MSPPQEAFVNLKSLLKASAVLIVVAACSGGGGGDSTGPTNNNNNNPGNNNPAPTNQDNSAIIVGNNSYSPASRTVSKGATVNWNWNSCTNDGYGDGVCVQHSVTFDDGVTSDQQSQGSFSRQFTAAGTYKYHCQVHGTAMSGTITVQ
jgi:plastocyanin